MQQQYGNGNNNRRGGNNNNPNIGAGGNVFGVPAHLTNGYAFHNAGQAQPVGSLDSGSAVAAAHAAQWNQQAAIAAAQQAQQAQQQQKLYDQYNVGANNI
jgi:acetoacetate decarboxylase